MTVRYPVWSHTEHEALITRLADHPLAGDVIPGARGLRKVRWRLFGIGERVIYYTVLDHVHTWLLIVYAKAKFDNLPVAFLNRLREAVG